MPAPPATLVRLMRPLVVLEACVVTGWLALAGASLFDRGDPLPVLDAAALAVGPTEETWMGLYLDGQHIGWSRAREAAAADGGRVFEQSSSFKLAAMGTVQEIVAAGSALTDAGGHIRQFSFLLSAPARIVGTGTYTDGNIVLDVTQAGSTSRMTIPVGEAPVIGSSSTASLRGRTLAPGLRFEVPWFDPLTRTNSRAEVTVEAPEVLPDGTTGWWMRTRVSGFETRKLVDAEGRVLREEGAMGLRAVAMSRENALAVDAGDPPDLVALASVPLEGPAPQGSRVTYVVSGVEPERLPSEPPLQIREGDRVGVSVPLVQELPRGLPVRADPEGNADELAASPSLPVHHPEIVARADAIVGDAPDRVEAARRLHDWVFRNVQKVPTIGLPNGLEVLRSGKGDCNEHTALYVSLARAAGLPSRIAAGLVYSARVGEAFYYHAWPEVRIGPTGADGLPGWVPVDPTLGQFPADGSHLKLVTGDLDRQVEIMGLMGRIRLRVAG